MIKTLWAKFDEMTIECFCEPEDRKCRDKECREYVVKFIEIDRANSFAEAERRLKVELRDVNSAVKKFQSEIAKNIKKMKKVKI